MINEYFELIEKEVNKCYGIANQARHLNYDPEDKVEIILARNMAERVEGIISTVAPQIKNSGIKERIVELEDQYSKLDWRVALTIALEVAQEKFCKFKDKKEAMEVSIRVALAYLTSGVVSSPLEGFVELKIKKRRDEKEYFCLMFSGPIRSAGTTIICGCLLAADYIRKNMGYHEYDPTEDEIKRMMTELYDYHERVTNLQYLPSTEEIEFLVKNLSLQISGDPSEKTEVSNYKNLPRIETDYIRNGPCLVLGEGLAQKAPKMWKNMFKWKDEFGLQNWNYINDFISLQKKIRSKGEVKKQETSKIIPDYNYIKDLVAGRPILTYPLRTGGFRLRYGRSRISGLSSMAMHPATMIILDDYIATGTQLRYERPGKSSAMEPCDSIEGPIVKLRNGDVLFLDTEEEARKFKKEIREILFLGDFLVNYGEFFNRAHKLVPCGYNEEWYLQELKKLDVKNNLIDKLKENRFYKISAKESFELSKKYNIPLHPRYTYHWNDINKEQFLIFIDWYKKGSLNENKILLPLVYDLKSELKDEDPKRILELLGIPHKVAENEYVVIENEDAFILYHLINFENIENKIKDNTLDSINEISSIKIRDKSGTFIGARMGRPEKAKLRKLTGNPNMLFPVGEQGGRMRNLQTAVSKGKVTADFSVFYCRKCNKETIYKKCEVCNNKTEFNGHRQFSIDVNHYFKYALNKLDLKEYNNLIRGVRGTSNKEHIPENLAKGILRSKYNLNVNKDGTIRYDMTEMPTTHFKPKEIFTSIKRLNELGYNKDIYGDKLENEEQLIEIKPQDIILPACEESNEDGADKVLTRIANYVDDLLEKFYGLERFYNIKSREDLTGHLVMGLAPHISAAIIGRIIGFSKTQGCFAHPLWHSAQRRDCEGDENCTMLLMDSLLNFSKHYLPNTRGATQDTPLVLTSILTPSEVDDMIFDMDLVWEYPLELYEAALEYKEPWEIKIEQLRDRLGKEEQFENWGFTHNVSNLNMGVRCSAYKNIPLMVEKVLGQMEIASKIRAVDEADVARLTIERHFIRDIKGNLRKFSIQQFRCVDCNEKYRRPPLSGKCSNCEGKLLFTIAEGSIMKYLEPSMQLAEKYNLPTYLKQTLELTKQRIEGVFGKQEDKQEGLKKWF